MLGEKQNLSPYGKRIFSVTTLEYSSAKRMRFSNNIMLEENAADESGQLFSLAFDLLDDFIHLLQKLAAIALGKRGRAAANFAHVAQVLLQGPHR